jgi:ABC-type uncharacterized transport system permease subunit
MGMNLTANLRRWALLLSGALAGLAAAAAVSASQGLA